MSVIKKRKYPEGFQDLIDINNELIKIYTEQLSLSPLGPNEKILVKKIKDCKKDIIKTKRLYKFCRIILCIK